MDIYKAVTDRIISQLEQGTIPWRKPWIASHSCISHATGKSYSLLNQMLLGRPGEYATFNQIRQAGGSVRRGEKAHMVVFWKWITAKDEETGEEKEVPFLRYYNVFHLDQCEGITAKHLLPMPQNACAHARSASVIADYVAREKVNIRHESSDRAFYKPGSDVVVLPEMAQFHSTAEYYSTAFHELVHSTGHATRLNRLDNTAFFGSEAYSKEELIAEIGLRLKAKAPIKKLLIVNHIAERIEYLPDKRGYDNRTFEGQNTMVKGGCAEEYIMPAMMEMMAKRLDG